MLQMGRFYWSTFHRVFIGIAVDAVDATVVFTFLSARQDFCSLLRGDVEHGLK